MAHKSLIKNVKYRNWVRAGCGLKYLQKGLEPFVDDILIQQLQNTLAQISGSVPVRTCNQCNVKTLKPNHVCDRYKRCPLGQPKCNCQYPNSKTACPNNVCGALYDKIIGSHASSPPTPNWNNAKSMFWCTNHWEFGKCFINASGYGPKNKASDIDCSGLLHVIINNIEFHSHIQSRITRSDVFSQAREIRNSVFHSPSMELDDTEVDDYIDVMIAVLEDPKELLMRQECINAVQNLKMLKQNKLIIKPETEEEVLKAAEYLIEEERAKALHQQVNDLKDQMQSQNCDLGKVKRKSKENLEKMKKSRREDKENINKSIGSLSERIDNLESKEKETLEDIESCQVINTKLDYVRRKHDFKRKLIDIYKMKFISNSVFPLRLGRVASISDVYVTPWMVVAPEGQRYRQLENGIDVTSLEEIFYKDGKAVKTIYILGEAGYGKSAFCKYLVYEWCLIQAEEEENEELNSFAEEIKKFEFLFFLSLRYCKVKGDNIHTMVEKQYDSTALEILENESGSCLVLIDGLDEWIPSLQVSTSQFQPQGIPVKDLTKDYTVITTSRPWKSRALNLDESEMEQTIELRGIRQDSVESFVNKTMKYIDETCDADIFTEDLRHSPVYHLASVPFMLLQLMCFWAVNKHLQTSRCEIFGSLLRSLFAWGAHTERNKNFRKVIRNRKDFCRNKRLDAIKTVQNQTDKFIILNVAKLAYSMLFSNEKFSLSVSQNDLRSLKIDEQMENILLELGLLTLEQDVSVSLIEKVTSYSFVHTVLQEYFAALYITTQCQTSSTEMVDPDKVIADHLKECKTICDVFKHSNVLVMICSLNTALTSYISKFIFRIVNADKHFERYRKETKSCDYEIYKIQDIIFSSINESISQEDLELGNSISLGDLVIDSTTDTKLCDYLNPRSVRSIHVQDCDKVNEEFFDCKSLSEYLTDDAKSSDVSDWSDNTRQSEDETSDYNNENTDSGSLREWHFSDYESIDECSVSSNMDNLNDLEDESSDNSTQSSNSYDLSDRECREDIGIIGQYGSDTSKDSSGASCFREGATDCGFIEERQSCRYDDNISRTNSNGEENSNGEASMNTERFDHLYSNEVTENEDTQTSRTVDKNENVYLNFLAKRVQKYQPVKLCIINCNLSDDDILAVRKMIGNCSQTMKCVAIQQKQTFPCSDSPVISTLIMSRCSLLTSLNLQLCESIPHEDMVVLTRFLERNSGLEQVTLARIACASDPCPDAHECSFVEHKHLKRIHFSDCDLLVNDVYSRKLQVCKLDSLDQTVVRNIMSAISVSGVKVFHLGMVRFGKADILFPYLPYLEELKFEKVLMTQASWLSFISKLPLMTLRDVEIRRLTLSQDVWNRFIDGLEKQKSIHIDTYELRVRKFQSLFSFYDDPSTEVTETARQYVREKGLYIFHDNYDTFEFEKISVD